METLLALMVNANEDQAVGTGQTPKLKGGGLKPLLDWSLNHLVRVADKAGWLPAAFTNPAKQWDEREALLGDDAQLARAIRNLAHPRRVLEDYGKGRFTKRLFEAQLRTCRGCRGALKHHNAAALLEAIEKEAAAQPEATA